jgi:glycosyltransferase involved in cell wall biosynthesis
VAPARLRVLPNAWAPAAPFLSRAEARAALGVPPGGPRVGWAGRLTPEKGPDVLVEAAGRLTDLDLAFSLLGAGSERDRLGARARALGLADRLTFHGILPRAGRLMRGFDLLVLSSRTEGTPIVLFEALAAGVPVVATAVGGVPDVVSAGEAVLVPPDDPAALADAIRRVVADPAAAASRARAGAARLAAAFGVEPWLDAYEEIYLKLAAERRTPRT